MAKKQIVTTDEDLKQAIKEGVKDAFFDVGIIAHDNNAVQDRRKDFEFLHDLRTASESTKAKMGMALIFSAVGGAISVMVLGIKAWLFKA